MFAQLAAAAVLAVLAPVWHLSGRAAQRLQLPAITGMILVSCRIRFCVRGSS
jgi:hypothetical protein